MGKYTDRVQGLFNLPPTPSGHVEFSHPASKRKADEKPAPEGAQAQEEPDAQEPAEPAESDPEL